MTVMVRKRKSYYYGPVSVLMFSVARLLQRRRRGVGREKERWRGMNEAMNVVD